MSIDVSATFVILFTNNSKARGFSVTQWVMSVDVTATSVVAFTNQKRAGDF